MSRTLFEKVWDEHVVSTASGQLPLLYVDLHLVHEVTSPQAFDGLRLAGRGVRRPDRTLATADHNTPTDGTATAALIKDQLSRVQVETLERNCAEFEIPVYSLGSDRQGIVHVIGPELGVTQPGMTIVCGDSHTSTHGAFGALAFGIGTSEVEHVLATQCMVQSKPRSMRIRYDGELAVNRGHEGLNVLTNEGGNVATDPKVQLIQGLLAKAPPGSIQDVISALQRTLRTHASGADQVGLCVHFAGGGTVSSTLLALSNADPGQNILLYADGPPCTTPYRDYHEVIRRLPSPD